MSKKAIECVDCQTGITVDSLRDRLIVEDKVAHIPGLEEMVEAVIKKRLPSLHQVGDELMGKVKAVYEVPAGLENSYRLALLDLYDRRLTSFV